jgi:hypothetical protein
MRRIGRDAARFDKNRIDTKPKAEGNYDVAGLMDRVVIDVRHGDRPPDWPLLDSLDHAGTLSIRHAHIMRPRPGTSGSVFAV